MLSLSSRKTMYMNKRKICLHSYEVSGTQDVSFPVLCLVRAHIYTINIRLAIIGFNFGCLHILKKLIQGSVWILHHWACISFVCVTGLKSERNGLLSTFFLRQRKAMCFIFPYKLKTSYSSEFYKCFMRLLRQKQQNRTLFFLSLNESKPVSSKRCTRVK